MLVLCIVWLSLQCNACTHACRRFAVRKGMAFAPNHLRFAWRSYKENPHTALAATWGCRQIADFTLFRVPAMTSVDKVNGADVATQAAKVLVR